MKKIGLVLLLFFCVSSAGARCKGQKLQCIKANAQAFMGGAAGSPSGTNFQLYFIAPAGSNKLRIDQLWIGDDFYEVTASLDQRNGSSNAFLAGDTISIRAQKINQNSMQLNNQTETATAIKRDKPFAAKGSALVGYTVGKKRKYLEVEKIEIMKRAEYQ